MRLDFRQEFVGYALEFYMAMLEDIFSESQMYQKISTWSI